MPTAVDTVFVGQHQARLVSDDKFDRREFRENTASVLCHISGTTSRHNGVLRTNGS